MPAQFVVTISRLPRRTLPKTRNHIQRLARNVRHACGRRGVTRDQQHERALVGGPAKQFVQETHWAGRVRQDS